VTRIKLSGESTKAGHRVGVQEQNFSKPNIIRVHKLIEGRRFGGRFGKVKDRPSKKLLIKKIALTEF